MSVQLMKHKFCMRMISHQLKSSLFLLSWPPGKLQKKRIELTINQNFSRKFSQSFFGREYLLSRCLSQTEVCNCRLFCRQNSYTSATVYPYQHLNSSRNSKEEFLNPLTSKWNSKLSLHSFLVSSKTSKLSFYKRDFHNSFWCSAGHNKWSKVKTVKGPKDREKSVLYTRLVKQIKIAVRDEGGPDPAFNNTLAQLINSAKAKGMPKNTIDNAISSKIIEAEHEETLEVRGPSGSLFLLETVSESKKKLRSSIGKILAAHNASLGSSGSAMFAFKRKGVVEVPSSAEGREPLTLDQATDLAIEVDAEDVIEESDEEGQTTLKFLCEPSHLPIVKDKLSKASFVPASARIQYVADMPITLAEADLQNVSALMEELEEHPNVLSVSDNISIE